MKFFGKALVGFLWMLVLSAQAQDKYWVFLKDKDLHAKPAISAKTLENRRVQSLPLCDPTDLPLCAAYESYLKKHHNVLNVSRWLNAVSAHLTPAEVQTLRQLPFVKAIQPIDGGFYIAKTAPLRKSTLAPVMAQVQSEIFQKAGLTGKGITIGVIDAGFLEAPSNVQLKHLFDRQAIIDRRDYVNPALTYSDKFYTSPESFSDFHGTEVMSAIAGMSQSQSGLAFDAKFYIARTDHGTREWRGEEDNWVAAMEWMDSLGVRLINTSLGYAKGFTNPTENYEPSQMDGKTSVISQAAQIATEKKGMLLIVSAGNEGDDPTWRIISTPADAPGVLAVGATNQRFWNRIGYSSIGPEFLPYLKPNVSCFSLYGTSLSAPVITGFAACLMQAAPTLTNKEVLSIIEKSAHLYPYGNNFVGYGVPLASRALQLIEQPTQMATAHAKSVTVQGEVYTHKVELQALGFRKTDPELVSVFHKKSPTHVLTQELVRLRDGQLTLKRQPNETHTTIDLKNEVVEVVWEK